MGESMGDAAVTAADVPARPVRSIGRRRGLPSGRAVVGAFLVTVSVVGLFTTVRRSGSETRTPYVVVASTIAAGETITNDDLAIRDLDIGELAHRTFTATEQVVGATAVQTMLPGQLVQEGTVLRASSGGELEPSTFEVTVALDRSRALAGELIPGELVDVVATIDVDGTSCTTVVAGGARVTRLGATTDDLISSNSDIAVTLAVEDDSDVLGLVYAVDESEVTLVRSTRSQRTGVSGAYCGGGGADQARPSGT